MLVTLAFKCYMIWRAELEVLFFSTPIIEDSDCIDIYSIQAALGFLVSTSTRHKLYHDGQWAQRLTHSELQVNCVSLLGPPIAHRSSIQANLDSDEHMHSPR